MRRGKARHFRALFGIQCQSHSRTHCATVVPSTPMTHLSRALCSLHWSLILSSSPFCVVCRWSMLFTLLSTRRCSLICPALLCPCSARCCTGFALSSGLMTGSAALLSSSSVLNKGVVQLWGTCAHANDFVRQTSRKPVGRTYWHQHTMPSSKETVPLQPQTFVSRMPRHTHLRDVGKLSRNKFTTKFFRKSKLNCRGKCPKTTST